MNIAVFLPNWVGDTVMATPALRALRATHPRPARLIGVGPALARDVLEGNPWLDAYRVYERPAARPEQGFWSVCRRLRRDHCDLAVILPNAPRHAALAWLAGARRRVGYDRRRRGWMLTARLMPQMKDGRFMPCSTLDYYLALAAAAGCTADGRAMELFTTKADEAAADAVWSGAGWAKDDRVVAVNNSGAFGEAKRWPEDYVAQLARDIVQQTGCRVLLVCGPAEREAASRVAAAAGPGVVSMANHAPGLGLTKACVRRSRLLVTTDSGPRHIGIAFNVPVVTLFGPTDEAWSDTGCARETRLNVPLACRPCQERTCPLGHHRCMRDLSVDCVLSATRAMLERVP